MSEATALFIKNARLQGEATDILVQEGIIAAVGKKGSVECPGDAEQYDAGGALALPSLIDAHVHLREPGFEWKEDIASGLTAASFGGFGAVMAMGNTNPVNDKAAVTCLMLDKAKASHPHGPKLYPIGALTVGLGGEQLAPLRELADAGCVAFSNDGKPVANSEIFRRGMEYAGMWDRTVIDHCEDPFLSAKSHMNEGPVSGRMGVRGQPTTAEALHVARDILLSEYLDIPVHLAHISCRQSVELIIWAKNRGLKVTAETCPHFLHFDETLLNGYNTNAKINPPLRSAKDVAYLRKALTDGVFDMLVTDHAPHAAHEKETALDEAPQGIIGLETALPLTWKLVEEGIIDEKKLIALWKDGPAGIFKLPAAAIKQGNAADIVLFDPDMEWEVGPETLHSKSFNTPLLGQTLKGKVSRHWLGGRRIV